MIFLKLNGTEKSTPNMGRGLNEQKNEKLNQTVHNDIDAGKHVQFGDTYTGIFMSECDFIHLLTDKRSLYATCAVALGSRWTVAGRVVRRIRIHHMLLTIWRCCWH